LPLFHARLDTLTASYLLDWVLGDPEFLPHPVRLIGRISYLAGDVSDGDYPPSTQEQDVKAMFESQLADLRKRLDAVVSGDLAGFNRMLRDKNIGNVIAGGQ